MCVSPLKGFQIGYNPSGKPNYLITSLKVHHLEQFKGNWQKMNSDFISPYADKVVRESIEIPCGHCVECRMKYARQWADRLVLESKKWDSNYFLTLTYNEKNLPHNYDGLMTLKPDDLQRFLKRLRRKVEPDVVRFYACGEYGDVGKRPHYHAIVFNLNIPDLEYYGQSTDHPIFVSEWLNKIWSNGFVVIAPVNWKTCAYTARYVMKKAGGKTKDYYDAIGIEPEFVRMSRRPGIASDCYSEKYYECDEIIFSDENGGHISKPPRYFDKKLEEFNPVLYELVKAKRRMAAENSKRLMLLQTSLSYEDILKNRELVIKQKALALKRQL